MDTKRIKKLLLGAGFFVIACLAPHPLNAQDPTPTPGDTSGERYTINSSVELGVRGIEVNGDHDKFRSDLNYKAGFRVFDSSFMIEDNATTGVKLFDSALITTSGWGSDPFGSLRISMDKTGIYKFDSNVRRVKYFNNLKNHAVLWTEVVPTRSLHRTNTEHYFGDFDLTIFPERDLRFRIGYSFNDTEGPGFYTARFAPRGEEFEVNTEVDNNSNDLRLGVEGELAGFNLGFNYGFRRFNDETRFFINSFNAGSDPRPGTVYVDLLARQYLTKGTTHYGHFYIQRTFADRLDFTGRFIYAESKSDISEADSAAGFATFPAPAYFIDLDRIFLDADAKRPQSRGDVGLTYRITDDFRISNTFTFDQYKVGGGNFFDEQVIGRNLSNGAARNTITATSSWRATAYKRFSNTIEADYQVNKRIGFNVGYRFTDREVELRTLDINRLTGAVTYDHEEEFENKTHTILFGTKIRPTNNWSIFADIERGESDNVFTRLANGDFFNFRIRSHAAIKQFTFDVSFITKDIDNPGTSVPIGTIPATESIAESKNRIFSTSFHWMPNTDFAIGAGWTYNHLNTAVDIIVPVGAPVFPSTRFLFGRSEYYVRDNHFFVDVSARPIDRIGLYAAYRINDDGGQGDRISTRPEDFITSYPMRFQSPEIRLAIKLTRNIDWNIGYQYYDYEETPYFNPFATTSPLSGVLAPQFIPAQNYSAHLPYTSVRIYFGKATQDR